MNITYHESTRQFHLYNEEISYMMKVLDDGELLHVYYGSKIEDKEDHSYSILTQKRSLALYSPENNNRYSMQHLKREYPNYGTGDFRNSAFEIKQENGSHITNFKYKSHVIFDGKHELEGLPATYVEADTEAKTLEITLEDPVIQVEMVLSYTIFADFNAIARNTKFVNLSETSVKLTKALSLNVDFQDSDFEMITLEGAWARERTVIKGKIRQGVQGIYSNRGTSSSEHNPFLALKRPETTEHLGEVFGFSLVYSGNHVDLAEVDTFGMTRVAMGINPEQFEWNLGVKESFQTPEAIMVYSSTGLNGMSQTFHKLYRTRLVRGIWRDKQRPVLLNNWEATKMNFTEDEILGMAAKGKELGIELFVLDDGWFGGRDHDRRGLGDWYVTDFVKLPYGIDGLAKKITDMGIDFGLWFEPEMVNEDSDLYRAHPEWVIATPNRAKTLGRNQYVLDFSNEDVVNYVYEMMAKVLHESNISYVKWDMNRYITECYSSQLPSEKQGEVFHRYTLGVYKLYELLLAEFPEVLFESCASGGSRFDAGMLYYAPQAWASDNTDAIHRLEIQYGTSMVYPINSIGAHVSYSPNHHTGRITPLETRANVAMFGTFGYELDIRKFSPEEMDVIRDQISFFKANRELIQKGTFYRLLSPFEGNTTSWMVVSEDKTMAIAGFYQVLNRVNCLSQFFKLKGLVGEKEYKVEGLEGTFFGNELEQIGLPVWTDTGSSTARDFHSRVYCIKAV